MGVVEHRKVKGYWFIFREMTWASFKVVCIFAFILSLLTIYNLSKMDNNDDILLELFITAVGMALFGGVIFYPLIIVINLLVTSPVSLFIIKKKLMTHSYQWVVLGAMISTILFWFFHQDFPNILTLKNSYLDFLAGGLTGYFFFKNNKEYITND